MTYYQYKIGSASIGSIVKMGKKHKRTSTKPRNDSRIRGRKSPSAHELGSRFMRL